MEKLKSILKDKKVIAIAVVVVIIIVFVIVRETRNRDEGEDGNAPSQQNGGSSQLPEAAFPLQVGEYSAAKGSYGRQIAELQKRCNDKYGTNLAVDGKYGPATYEAFGKYMGVNRFSNGINVLQYSVYMKN